MLTWRRVLLAITLLLVASIAWSIWLAVQTARDLRDAQNSVDRIRAAITAQDSDARQAAIQALQASASSAKDRTGGIWWKAMTWSPFVGDDASGVRELSASLDLVATKAIGPLGETVDDLGKIAENGRVDVDKVAALQGKVTGAHEAFASAAAMVRSQDSAGFAGAFRSRYNEYVDTVSGLEQDLGSAETAVQVLPNMLGAEGPRRYLLIFENNAEIRATGGLPGSWALVKADNGKLEMTEQGAATDFKQYAKPIGGITSEERLLFGREMGRFFQDPNFTPDFPRAAEVFNAFWDKKSPDEPLDGVISIDVVGLSHLLDGLPPIQAGGLELTADNLVDQLLSKVYEEPDVAKQDLIFQAVARSVFDTTTNGLDDPVAFVEGMSRAATEGRFHVASFGETEALALKGTRVEGALSGEDGATPHVDIALNDATASKMSYYLRYHTEVRSLSCEDGVQRLGATITLSQTISPTDAAALPPYVTGPGPVGTMAGNQLVRVHVFAPSQGVISDIKINGEAVTMPRSVEIRGRSAVTLAVLIDSLDDVVVTLDVDSGPGQTSDGLLSQTPSVVSGDPTKSFRSSC